MSDISKCSGVSKDGRKCPLKHKCHRYTAPTNDYWQTYSEFTYTKEDGCKDFWNNSDYHKEKKGKK